MMKYKSYKSNQNTANLFKRIGLDLHNNLLNNEWYKYDNTENVMFYVFKFISIKPSLLHSLAPRTEGVVASLLRWLRLPPFGSGAGCVAGREKYFIFIKKIISNTQY